MARWLITFVALAVGCVLGTLVGATLLQKPRAEPPGPKELGSYRDIVKKALPAVVSLEAKVKSAKKPADDLRKFEDGPRPPDGLDDFPQLGFGSGFLIDAKGTILTNYHVVEGAPQVDVHLMDGRKFTTKDVRTDPKTDLALVVLDAKEELPYLEFGDVNEMEIGDRVLAVGAPFGLTGSVTSGIVSGKGRSLRLNFYEDFVQTDAAINPGNSGGPLINLEGKVVGINSAIKTRSGGSQGVGLAIASNLAKSVAGQLLKDGTVRRGYLGVQMKESFDRELNARLGVDKDVAVLVTLVFPNTPAAKAGIQDGDVITEVAGRPIRSSRELQSLVAALPLDKEVEVRVVRDGEAKTFGLTVEEQPKDYGTARAPVPKPPERIPDGVKADKAGLEFADLTPELAKPLGFKESAKGALVLRVTRGGAAAEAGLVPGMLITRVEKQEVAAAEDCKEALDKAALDKGVLVRVSTPSGGTNFVLLKAKSEN